MGTHRKIVGVLHLSLGVMALFPVMVLTAIFGGIWGVVAVATHGHEAATIVGVSLAAILFFVVIATAVVGMLGITAGAGVLLGRRWGDVLASVLSVVHLFNVPVGTGIALYTGWALWFAEPAPVRAFPVREADLQTSP